MTAPFFSSIYRSFDFLELSCSAIFLERELTGRSHLRHITKNQHFSKPNSHSTGCQTAINPANHTATGCQRVNIDSHTKRIHYIRVVIHCHMPVMNNGSIAMNYPTTVIEWLGGTTDYTQAANNYPTVAIDSQTTAGHYPTFTMNNHRFGIDSRTPGTCSQTTVIHSQQRPCYGGMALNPSKLLVPNTLSNVIFNH